MCVIGAGSPAQPLIAALFQLVYLLTVLKTAPYDSDGDDWSAFITNLTLFLTMLGGFALSAQGPDPSNQTFDGEVLGYLIVAITMFCLFAEVCIMVLLDCGLHGACVDRCSKRQSESAPGAGNGAPKSASSTKVAPAVEAAAALAWDPDVMAEGSLQQQK